MILSTRQAWDFLRLKELQPDFEIRLWNVSKPQPSGYLVIWCATWKNDGKEYAFSHYDLQQLLKECGAMLDKKKPQS